MTGAAKWMQHCSRAVAAAVLVGGLGPPSLTAGEPIPSFGRSEIPLSFADFESQPRRTGVVVEVGRDTDETGALSPGIEIPRDAVRQRERRVHGTIRDEMATVRLSGTRIRLDGLAGVRIRGLWAFEHVDRLDTSPDRRDVNLFGLFVDAGDSYSVNANFSRHFDPTQMTYDDGSLLALGYSTELGLRPDFRLRPDILYASGYWAEGDFRWLADSATPPLGPVGPSLSGVGFGSNRPALWHRPLDSAGFAIGTRTFFAERTANWTVELGHRQDLEKKNWLANASGTALTTRAQYRLAERLLLRMDAYFPIHVRDSPELLDAETDKESAAVRVELRVNF